MLAFEQLKNSRPSKKLGLECECYYYHYSPDGPCRPCSNKDIKWVCTSYYIDAAKPAILSYCQSCIDNHLIKNIIILNEKEKFIVRLYNSLGV